MAEKTAGEKLAQKLMYDTKNAFEAGQETVKDAYDFCEGYKKFLDDAKTEREAVDEVVKIAQREGFSPFDPKKAYAPGDKVYLNNRGKAISLVVFGKEDLEKGVLLAAAHIDNPRLDLKQRPLYEDSELAMMKTHYYGGIKKYQWTSMPLALHGVVCKKDGSKVSVVIGEKDEDPVFCVTDLLPHLAKDQMKKTMAEGIQGENLTLLFGSKPYDDDKVKDRVKLAVMNLLYESYGITEEDFLSAELVAVPAFKARDLGLDRSFVGAYGHDDRVCAYTMLKAILDAKQPERTCIAFFADKEEVGSMGNTGMRSASLRYLIEDLAQCTGANVRRVMEKSVCVSADVNAAFDPLYPDVVDKRNCAYANHGIVISKYTGSAGKYNTSDASADFMAYIRNILDGSGVYWQTGELGKVDHGGGGTVAQYVADLGIDVVDIGVPILSMHAPFEVAAKMDIYMGYKAFFAFYEAK